jgi:hypothetical protein
MWDSNFVPKLMLESFVGKKMLEKKQPRNAALLVKRTLAPKEIDG